MTANAQVSPSEREWDELVAGEVERQARIEAAFDRVDSCTQVGDLEGALAWLDEASAMSGGLSPTYRAERAHIARRIARRDELDETCQAR
jgi:hypothetical protein